MTASPSTRDYLSFLIATLEAQRNTIIRARAHLSVSDLIGDRLNDPDVSARALAIHAHLLNAANSLDEATVLIRAIGDSLPASIADEPIDLPDFMSAEGRSRHRASASQPSGESAHV